ncbi:MAG TPA: hypothetical protein VK875_10385 [Euzebyales bacterium]|nr:hypothetical protein [Euzebyales bacterium]
MPSAQDACGAPRDRYGARGVAAPRYRCHDIDRVPASAPLTTGLGRVYALSVIPSRATVQPAAALLWLRGGVRDDPVAVVAQAVRR